MNPRPGGAAARKRLLPGLASLLGVAIDRQRLAAEAFEAESLRRSDSVKTAILRAVSHDLRSPFMAILTSASALARADLELDGATSGSSSRRSCTRPTGSTAVIGNLLDLSRLEAGAAQPEPEVWAGNDLVARALTELGEAGGRVCDVELPEEPAGAVPDEWHCRSNAYSSTCSGTRYKYSPEAEPVRVQVTQTTNRVLVRVVDHGPGVVCAG